MAPTNLIILDTAIERLKGTLAVLKFVEQRLPGSGSSADLAAISGLKVAYERLAGLATELESLALVGREADSSKQASQGDEAGATAGQASHRQMIKAQAA